MRGHFVFSVLCLWEVSLCLFLAGIFMEYRVGIGGGQSARKRERKMIFQIYDLRLSEVISERRNGGWRTLNVFLFGIFVFVRIG
ncbi:uncharacterized protein V1516DRAFT_375167 [Lipomyces oligophaga]|uniref:uncharacterized protein n=1 Tax=Lipomyces oligophaga TaxID=45792 RepID=UPI0034CE48E7